MNFINRKKCGQLCLLQRDTRDTMARHAVAAVGGVFICLLCSLILGGCGDRDEELALDRVLAADEESAQQPVSVITQEQDSEEDEVICVYVCGAVTQPGVVELPSGSRADDAVRMAGGMTQEADCDYVNLAQLLTDGEKLYIPSVREAMELEQRMEEEADGLVNINTAGADKLCTLPGIGESRARDIISYREQNGSFASIEDIMKVPGIKAAAFEKIKEKITV